MCGRYVLKSTGKELKQALRLVAEPVLKARYNLAPLQAAPVVLNSTPRVLSEARWGLLPIWAKDTKIASRLINARSEAAADTPSFRDAVKRRRRCVVPCDGFYEWRRDGKLRLPYYITPVEGGLLTLAGLYSTWKTPEGMPVLTFTILTMAANEDVRPLHERMPVFVRADMREAWLSEDDVSLATVVADAAAQRVRLLPVDSRVNRVANDDSTLIQPQKESGGSQLSLPLS